MTEASLTHLVLIPSYNPGPKVLDTVRAARAQWTPVWVVVDGSTDGSDRQLQAMAAADPGLHVIDGAVMPANPGVNPSLMITALAERVRMAAMNAEAAMALTRIENLPTILQRWTEVVVTHLDAAFARIWTLNAAGDTLELQASAGMYTHLDGPHSRVPVGQFKIGLIAAERRAYLTNAVAEDPRIGDPTWARREGLVAFAQPGGTTTRHAYETLRDELLAELRAALPVDAVLLSLHGAMIADGYDSCDGDLLARVRALVGPEVPIGAELDPHAHLDPAMLASAMA